MTAAAQLPALDGAQKLPKRAAFRRRHLGSSCWGRDKPPPAAVHLPWAPARVGLAGERRMLRASTSSSPGPSSLPRSLTSLWRCRVSLQVPLFPCFPAGTDQALFFPFPTGKIQQCQHLPRCSIANWRPEVVLKQQLHLLGRHRQAAKTLQFAIA